MANIIIYPYLDLRVLIIFLQVAHYLKMGSKIFNLDGSILMYDNDKIEINSTTADLIKILNDIIKNA